MVLLKEDISTLIVVLLCILLIFRLFMFPVWGNPITKAQYYIGATIYIIDKYEFVPQLEIVYDWETYSYTIYAKMPKNYDGRFLIVKKNGQYKDDLMKRIKGEYSSIYY